MRKLSMAFIAALTLFNAPLLHAQGAHDAIVHFAKVDHPGFMADYPMSADLVEVALKERFAKAGFEKAKNEKGFTAYQGANWPDVSTGHLDVYTKVEGKGDKSTVMMLVSKGYDNYISSATDGAEADKIKAFLNGFIEDARAYQLKQMVLDQAAAIFKAEKAYNRANEDGDKLAREKEKIEKQQAENTREKAQLAEALSAEKAKMTALQAQQK